jgi:calcineurin-like phosphoesterase family protein
MRELMNKFFTADTHFNHHNIIKYCQRPYQWIGEMNEALINNWNKVVGENDEIYHLGDFGFGQQLQEIFDRLNGRKFLVTHKKATHDSQNVFHLDWEYVHYGGHLLPLGGRPSIWLDHHAHRSWPQSFHGSWHLFGHTHNRLPPYGRSFDVGVDGHNYYPWSYEEVEHKIKELEKDMEKKGIGITI